MNCIKWREETQETCPHIAHNLLSRSGQRGNRGKGKSLGNADALDLSSSGRDESPSKLESMRLDHEARLESH